MPNYDYDCMGCGSRKTHLVPYEERNEPVSCELCGGNAVYQFPVGAKLQVREGFYCEPLGCDVTGNRDMIEKAKRLGYMQTGDKVGGARNDESSGKLPPPQGKSFDDVLRRRDEKAERKENWKSYAQNKGGEVPVKESSSLKSAVKVRHLTANKD
jgi:putative FmdB family regulatory protein|tara:strand:- start:3676 stop:4140 length:465 start_codon:yes stop_codon:yes gene_type:complete